MVWLGSFRLLSTPFFEHASRTFVVLTIHVDLNESVLMDSAMIAEVDYGWAEWNWPVVSIEQSFPREGNYRLLFLC